MPKIIEDIETKILNAAYELFCECGWQNTDMRKIAAKAGIGVGTLYNYYENKNQLLINVFKLSWQNTVIKLENAMKIQSEPKEKINLFMEILHDGLNSRRNIGRLLRNNASEREFEIMIDMRKEFSDKLVKMMHEIMAELKAKHGLRIREDMEYRFSEAFVILMTIENFIYKDEKEENIRFINELLKLIY
ncbi:TetR/AcrR family transcriptional regulator [Clostridium sp. ZS2-4]|uniref:TetR/AcrR family transcriptional regulator n=1 Tax=Clostridium sp. ZS2-4 TaxID=2987703 RepID=UPI00227BB79C|nr:TetR/AcrR family transcriptional regulator [Clostridium sp. ZS2-4]MCY6355132.1 TetR/AcrR family transcriptional regulator [Clostridium sp. ZS2-4]